MKAIKLKATLLTEDGETWLVIRQHYASDLKTNGLLDDSFQGLKLKTIHEEETKNESINFQPKSS